LSEWVNVMATRSAVSCDFSRNLFKDGERVGGCAARWPMRRAKPSLAAISTAFRLKTLPTLAEALPAKWLPLHTPNQDAVDLTKMVQVVCRFQADELLDRLPSAHLVDPIALHPPYARDRLQQSQVALAQRPKDPCRKARILLRVTQALRPYGLISPR
jgi:hypothetical protein